MSWAPQVLAVYQSELEICNSFQEEVLVVLHLLTRRNKREKSRMYPDIKFLYPGFRKVAKGDNQFKVILKDSLLSIRMLFSI